MPSFHPFVFKIAILLHFHTENYDEIKKQNILPLKEFLKYKADTFWSYDWNTSDAWWGSWLERH